MARLILLNGPPGIGKTTLAQRYVDGHSLALALDIDAIRAHLGQWTEHSQRAGVLARAMALEMARVHLGAGHDVVVPQLLARAPFIEDLERLAAEVGASFHEIVLLDTKEAALARFERRSRERAAAGEHRSEEELVERDGGLRVIEDHYDRLTELLASREGVVLIRTRSGEVDAAYADLLRHLDVTDRSP